MKRIITAIVALSATTVAACDFVELEGSGMSSTQDNQSPPAAGEASTSNQYSDEELLALAASEEEGASLSSHEAARKYVQLVGIAPAAEMSHDAWSGKTVERDRRLSTLIAAAAFEVQPQEWSALRMGIGYLNGVGVEQSTDKAIKTLSSDLLAESGPAQYFLSLAHEKAGDSAAQEAALRRAADLGHPVASQALEQ